MEKTKNQVRQQRRLFDVSQLVFYLYEIIKSNSGEDVAKVSLWR